MMAEMIDHVFVNAVGAHGNRLNIAVKNGCFAIIGYDSAEAGDAEINDLQNYLVLPGFINSHIHLDKNLIGIRIRLSPVFRNVWLLKSGNWLQYLQLPTGSMPCFAGQPRSALSPCAVMLMLM